MNGVERATDRYDELMEWFVNSDPNSYVSPKVDIRPSTRGGLSTGGYGTFVSDDIEEGELLLRLPRSCCVTLDDALNDVECGSGFRKLLETAGPGAGEWLDRRADDADDFIPRETVGVKGYHLRASFVQ